MSVLATAHSTTGVFAPRRAAEAVSSARLGVWRASDLPKNHKVLCGARIAAVSQSGTYSGFCGHVAGVDYNFSYAEEKESFSVKYDIRFENGERQWVGPLKLFQGLLFFKEYATSENDVLARQEISQAEAHIANLVDLNDDVRSANVLERHVCRNVQTNDAENPSVLLVGRVSGFRIIHGVPKWSISYVQKDFQEDIGKEELETGLMLYEAFVNESMKQAVIASSARTDINNRDVGEDDRSVSTIGGDSTTNAHRMQES